MKWRSRRGFSPAHFFALVQPAIGFPAHGVFYPHENQRACRFLTLTPLSIKEISSRLGYSDQYYFSRIFHKVMGIPPAACQRNQSG